MDNINNINKYIVLLLPDIICWNGQLLKKDIDMNYNENNFNLFYQNNLSIEILKPIIYKIKMSEKYLFQKKI